MDPVLRHFTRTAASIQEKFDTEVLGLPWNKSFGPEPDAEHWAFADPTGPKLKDWYPTGVSELPMGAARLLCQRSACWWDGRLRRRFSIALYSLVAVALVGMLGAGVWRDKTVADFVLLLLAPSFPALTWGLKEARRQWESATTMDRLKAAATADWRDAVSRKLSETKAELQSRLLQDAILRAPREGAARV